MHVSQEEDSCPAIRSYRRNRTNEPEMETHRALELADGPARLTGRTGSSQPRDLGLRQSRNVLLGFSDVRSAGINWPASPATFCRCSNPTPTCLPRYHL